MAEAQRQFSAKRVQRVGMRVCAAHDLPSPRKERTDGALSSSSAAAGGPATGLLDRARREPSMNWPTSDSGISDPDRRVCTAGWIIFPSVSQTYTDTLYSVGTPSASMVSQLATNCTPSVCTALLFSHRAVDDRDKSGPVSLMTVNLRVMASSLRLGAILSRRFSDEPADSTSSQPRRRDCQDRWSWYVAVAGGSATSRVISMTALYGDVSSRVGQDHGLPPPTSRAPITDRARWAVGRRFSDVLLIQRHRNGGAIREPQTVSVRHRRAYASSWLC